MQKLANNLILSKYSIVLWLFLTILIFNGKNLIGLRVTTWDTHDLGFVNFLYFVDALKSGYLPFWNPFIQGGVFFPSLNNAGLYTIFQIPFELLSMVFNPSVIFEWMIQFFILLGGLGTYFYFRVININQEFSIFGALTYTIVNLVSFTGQYGFIVSLGSLPWMLFIIHLIGDNKISKTKIILIGIILGMYIVSGYPWMNFVNIALVFMYFIFLWKEKIKFINSIIFFISIVIIYFLFLYPGLDNLSFNYSLFLGDLQNYEPRLRSLGIQNPGLLYNTIFDSFIGLLEPLLYGRNLPTSFPLWASGLGIVMAFLFFYLITVEKIILLRNEIFYLFVILFFLLYSSAVSTHLVKLTNLIPFFNSNRWFGLGNVYAQIGLIFVTITLMQKYISSCEYNFRIKYFIFIFVMCLFVILTNKPDYKFIFVLIFMVFTSYIFFKYVKKYTALSILFLILISLVYFNTFRQYGYWKKYGKDYNNIIDSRVQSVEILENNRQVFDSVEYVFNNQEWIVNKIPSTHGYNNLGNPWYWYFKNHEFNSRIIDISRNISTIKSLQRKEFINDNTYYDTFTKEIENNLPKYSVFEEDKKEFEFDEKFNFKIIKFSVLPNNVELNLKLSSNALISYNVPYAPNWEVYIDGVKDKIIRTNGFFMGVYVSEGTHNITFEYKPYLVYICFLLAYLLFIVSIIANFIKREKNVR